MKKDFSHPDGRGGKSFDSERGTHVHKVCISTHENRFVESIQLFFHNGRETGRYGGKQGTKTDFVVLDGDAIVKVKVRRGWGTDAIKFFTRQGRESDWLGGKGGTVTETFSASNPAKQELVGISGRSGWLLDRVVFHFDKPIRKVVCKLEPIFEIAKNVGYHETTTIKYKVGSRDSTYSSQEMTKLATQAKANISWGVGGAGGGASFDAQTANAFHSASAAVSREYEYSKTVTIDARNHGVFLYRGVMQIHLCSGKTVTMQGECLVGSPTALVAKDYEFN